MTRRIAYYRVSTRDQSAQVQCAAMGGGFDVEFMDESVSGLVMAAKRSGFATMLQSLQTGDTVCLYSLDRLGRDALDVQNMVLRLLDEGVTVYVHELGPIGRGAGEIILAVLAQVADMERRKILERCEAGRAAARAALAETGRTHRGKESLGRPRVHNGADVVAWRTANSASITATARQFGISVTTVKRYGADVRNETVSQA